MSMPAPATIERERNKLWITDAELIRLTGLPEKRARQLLREWDSKPLGFPRKQEQFGGRRYKPAVVAYFDKHFGGSLLAPQKGERR
jgi:hypothetical protein